MSSPKFPFTIGYGDNSVLSPFISRYEKLLFELAQEHIDKEITQSDDVLDFLTIGDIASNLILLSKEKVTKNAEDAKVYLQKEWKNYKKDGLSGLLANQGRRIPGTKILLTDIDYTPGSVSRINHPSQKDGAQLSGFSHISEDDWIELYAGVFEKIKLINPGFCDEIENVLQKIVPIGVSKNCHNSGSFSDCIGHIYMSYPVGGLDPLTAVLEAVIHEYNHNKLHIIKVSDPLILNSGEEIYYSPYRPDARHLYGIFAGLHALSAVLFVIFTGIKEKKIDRVEQLVLKSLLYFMKDEASIRVLEKYCKLTDLGQTILSEMKEVHRETLKIIKDLQFSHDLLGLAAGECRIHFIEAQKNNKILLY